MVCSVPKFPSYQGDPHHSDHRHIIVVMNDEAADRPKPGGQSFRFEAGCIQEDNCRTIVHNAWNLTMEARSGTVVEAVREVGAELWDWSRNILGDLGKRIKRVKRELEACRRRSFDAYSVGREEILK